MAKKTETNQDAKEVAVEAISKAEYDRRTKLDVSDAQYINPSLDHFKG